MCSGPPAGGPTTTWADCSAGLDPTKQGGDLLWTEIVQSNGWPAIAECLPSVPHTPALQLAVGSTGDVALGITGCDSWAASAVQRFNGSGTALQSLARDYASEHIPPGQTLGLAHDGAMVVIDAAGPEGICCNGEDWISVSGSSATPVSWSVAGASNLNQSAPWASVGPAWDADALGSFFTVATVTVPPNPSATTVAIGSLMLGAGTYLVRAGSTGESAQAGFSGSFVADQTGGVYRFDALATTLDLGCGPMVPASSSSAYVARFGPTWSCVYSHVLPAAASVLPDANGGAILIATSTSSLDLGCGALPAAAGGSTFVTHLDPSGSCVFGKSLPAPGLTVSIDPGGKLVVSGLVGATAVDLGGGPLAPLGSQDFVLAELDASGNFLWGKRFGGPGITFASPKVSTSASGDVYVLTGWKGAVDLGGGPLSAAAGDTVAGSFSSSGAYRWGRAYTFPADALTAVDGCGSLVVATFTNFDPGCGDLFPPFPAGCDSWATCPCKSFAECPYTGLVRYAP